MSNREIQAIEQQIGTTRERIAVRLQELASPEAWSNLSETLKAEAVQTKDEWIDRAKDAGQDYAQGLLQTLKNRAVENPIAVAAIAAGIGWKMWKDPPISMALIGVGVASLISDQPGNIIRSVLKYDQNGYSDRIAESAGRMSSNEAPLVPHGYEPRSPDGAHPTEQVDEIAHAGGSRDQVLVGVAGAAVAAAVGIAVQQFFKARQ